MTINERVKYFRKNILQMNQTEFAKKLGMKQTGISYMEHEGSTVTDQTIKVICSEFNVNETWLRTGTGEMFKEESYFDLDEYAKSQGASPLETEIARIYFSLDKEVRQKVLKDFILKIQNIDIDNLK